MFSLNLLLVSSTYATCFYYYNVSFHWYSIWICCVLCWYLIGLKRSDFDNKQVTFKGHVQREHWMWDYLHFYVLLEEKAPTELTGPESYVKKLIMVCMCVCVCVVVGNTMVLHYVFPLIYIE